jgi:hypothetical protein
MPTCTHSSTGLGNATMVLSCLAAGGVVLGGSGVLAAAAVVAGRVGLEDLLC